MKLKTLEESLLEAQGGEIDTSMGYSVLKDIYKRQNFTVKSSSYIGKKKIQFVYTDPESKDEHKLRNLQLSFFVKKLDEKDFKTIENKFIKTPNTSFVTNRYGKYVGIMARKQGTPDKIEGAETRLKVLKENTFRNKSSEYTYVVEFFDSENGSFIDAYQIDINATP